MRYSSRMWSAVVFSVAGLFTASIAQASGLSTLTDLSMTPGSPSNPTALYPTGINNQGQIVGNAIGSGVDSAWVISGGQFTQLTPTDSNAPLFNTLATINDSGSILLGVATLHTPLLIQNGVGSTPTGFDGANGDVVNALNNHGVIVGNQYVGSGVNMVTQPFILDGSTRMSLDLPAGSNLYARAINDQGAVLLNTGYTNTGESTYVYLAGQLTNIGSLGSGVTMPIALNNAGQVLATSMAPGGSMHAVLWSNGHMTDLGDMSAFGATAMNSAGTIVGTSGDSRAMMYQNGVQTDLNTLISHDLGYTLVSATGINDLGQIVGQARNSHGDLVGYLLTPDGVTSPANTVITYNPAPPGPQPVPEPATIVMFGLVVAGVAIKNRKSFRV